MKYGTPFIFILLSIVFQSLSGVFSKYSATSINELNLISVLTNFFYLISLFFLFLQAVVWQQALRYYPLSFAYPFMSLVNFVVLISAAVLFHEGITLFNLIGLVFISLGIALLSRKIGETV